MRVFVLLLLGVVVAFATTGFLRALLWVNGLEVNDTARLLTFFASLVAGTVFSASIYEWASTAKVWFRRTKQDTSP